MRNTVLPLRAVEADAHRAVNARASSSREFSTRNCEITQRRASSHAQTTRSEEAGTTVFHEQ
ncbi:MAG TPA: hypothetical protein VFH52_08825 [Rhodanobacteraceae bacterium]|nr:hypothetical protein [Rhodanobacteraceae bacterium]